TDTFIQKLQQILHEYRPNNPLFSGLGPLTSTEREDNINDNMDIDNNPTANNTNTTQKQQNTNINTQ
ncbi:1403_t:CDS:1, partial [Racocetra fulgida]